MTFAYSAKSIRIVLCIFRVCGSTSDMFTSLVGIVSIETLPCFVNRFVYVFLRCKMCREV